MTVKAYAAFAGDEPLESIAIVRRPVGARDVQIDIAYCGLCHSDLHQVRGEWAGTVYPCVPGHEIVGAVTAVGAHVANFKEGDLVEWAASSTVAGIAKSAMPALKIIAIA